MLRILFILLFVSALLLRGGTVHAQLNQRSMPPAGKESPLGSRSAKPKRLAKAVSPNPTAAPVDTARRQPSRPRFQQRALRPTMVKRLTVRGDGTPDFSNVNKVAFYEDKKALKEIQKAERKHRYEVARRLLQDYVAHFGIDNFYRNTDLLWHLGQLLQRDSSQQERAKAYFRLALKHHRTDVRRVQLYYDSLEQKNADLYVPLKVYYDIVEYRKSINTFHPPKGVYTNMGSGINSEAADYGPTLGTGDTVLLFSSKRKQRGSAIKQVVDEDLYTSHREGPDFWTDAVPLPKPINSQYNEGSACFSHDGRTIFFARCECPSCHGNCDLFTATLGKDGKWSVPKSLGPQVNSPNWDSQPALSPREDTLYFASDRLGGFGLSDIYYTVKGKNGQWGKAMNMGPVVNTRESEVSPYFHPKYQVLYFSSRGQLLNFGDFDIYKTYRVNGRWQEPRNIGPLVNGQGSEYYFAIDSQSKNLYYARSEAKEIQNLDLYSFPLPMEAQPLATTQVSGTLVDSVSRKPLSGIVSIIDLDNGIEVASKYLRPDGSFDFQLIDGSRYAMLIQSPDFFSVEKQFALKGDTVMTLLTNSIDYKLPLIFKNLEFEKDKASILPSMQPALDRIALFLVDHPTFRLSIAGHTDSKGDPDVNEKLSQDRAAEIRRYIERKGKLNPSRIDSYGYGSSRPLKDELTEADASVNRRVEFRLLKPEPAAGAGDANKW
jgi:flagellar motor protein MotB